MAAMKSGCERIPRATQPVMPWANGGGSTRQVAIDPPDGSLQRGFHWRISIARVASDGPFSHLPGIDRSLWLLAGAGMRLLVDGREVVLDRALQRFDCRGETPIECRLLAGPCEDLNVMVARAHVRAALDVRELAEGAACAFDPAASNVVVVLRGQLVDAAASVCAEAGDAVRCDGPALSVLRAACSSVVLHAAFARRTAPDDA